MSAVFTGGIEGVLAQMREVAGLAATPPAAAQASTVAAKPDGFSAELRRSLAKVSQLQNDATAQAQAWQLGEAGPGLSDVMLDLQKASLAFQTTVQVRNRLVAAYQEIAGMPV